MRKGCICESKGLNWESTIETFAITLVLAGMFVLMHAVMFTINSLAIRWRTRGNLSWKAIENRKCRCPYHKTVKPAVLSLVEEREKSSKDSEKTSEELQEATVASSALEAIEDTQLKDPLTAVGPVHLSHAEMPQNGASSDQCSTSLASPCITKRTLSSTGVGMHSI